MQWIARLARLPAFGTERWDVQRARRLYVVNVVAIMAVCAALFFTLLNLFTGEPITDRFVIIDLLSAVAFAAVIALGRYSYLGAASLLIFLGAFLALALSLQLGRLQGAHYLLIGVGPLVPLLFGSRPAWLSLAVAAVGVLLFLAIEFILPMTIYFDREWLPQIRNPLVESLDLDIDDVFFISILFVLEMVLTLSTLVAVRIAENAEAALAREHARSESLLQSILPRPVAARLKERPDEIVADEFDRVTVLFADVVGFTPRAASRKPVELVHFLNRVFSEFDALAEKHGLEKIKTIGDCYMVAGGMPDLREGHTSSVAEMALDMIEAAERLTGEFGEEVAIRIGIHVGSVVAGVIGKRKPLYDVWGDTINVAARMESNGLPGRIQITPEVRELLGDGYEFEPRGAIDVKGKGAMTTYFLKAKR